jgi:hypothetical protein
MGTDIVSDRATDIVSDSFPDSVSDSFTDIVPDVPDRATDIVSDSFPYSVSDGRAANMASYKGSYMVSYALPDGAPFSRTNISANIESNAWATDNSTYAIAS